MPILLNMMNKTILHIIFLYINMYIKIMIYLLFMYFITISATNTLFFEFVKNIHLILSVNQNTYTLKRQIVHIEGVGCSGKHITDIIVT